MNDTALIVTSWPASYQFVRTMLTGGEPQLSGQILVNHYQDRDKVQALINGGNVVVLRSGVNSYPGTTHDNWTYFAYPRQVREWSLAAPQQADQLERVIWFAIRHNVAWIYMWTAANPGHWLVLSVGDAVERSFEFNYSTNEYDFKKGAPMPEWLNLSAALQEAAQQSTITPE